MWISKTKIYSMFEMKQDEKHYKNSNGDVASMLINTYSNKALGKDHHVFIKDHRTTTHSTEAKAHKKLVSMGYHPMEK